MPAFTISSDLRCSHGPYTMRATTDARSGLVRKGEAGRTANYHSRRARFRRAVWRTNVRGTLAATQHGRIEAINAICRAAFAGQFDPKGLTEALGDLTAD